MKIKTRPRASTIGRESFAKISAIEGIRVSRRVEEDFKTFDREGLSAAERRRRLVHKYGSKS